MAIDKSLSTVRSRLIEAAVRLLSSHGPSEVKARSVSSEAGLSTMGVYTYFGGVPELLQAVADEGFKRQSAYFAIAQISDDPMTNLCAMALACRDFAQRNPHLYDLMFGLSIQGRYSASRGIAVPAVKAYSPAFNVSYGYLFSECSRLVASSCVSQNDPALIAVQFWSALHGFIMLELGGHFVDVADPSADILVPMCISLVVGLGAKSEQAQASAASAISGWAERCASQEISPQPR